MIVAMQVSELSVDQLKALVREAVSEALSERDPDFGLSLRPEVEERLRRQLASPGPGIPLAEVARELGLTR